QAGATGTGAGNVQEASFNTLVVAGDASLQNFLMSGGTLTGAANLMVSGTLTWSGGTMTGGGHTTVNGTTALSGFPTLDTRTLYNYGAAVWTGGGFVAANNGGIWNNQPGSLFDAQADASFVNFSGAPVQFNNRGLVRKSAGSGTTSLGVAFTNAGTVHVQTGTLSFDSLSNFAGGTLTGGIYILEGTLHLNGDLQTNAATVMLDGPSAQITDVFGSNALASFAANTAAGRLRIQNGG